MDAPTRRGHLIRFSVFELNLDSAELFKRGRKVKLQGQPFEVLLALLNRPGEVVSRDELKQKLWPTDTAGDFDQGLNRAINKVRDALGDTAESPHFVETLPRRGYRFISSIQDDNGAQSAPVESSPIDVPIRTTELPAHEAKRGPSRRTWLIPLAAAVLAFFVADYLYLHRVPNAKLTNKDKIVLADFTNSTGDPLFDGTLRQGLAVQLEQSPFLSLVSEERVRQVMPLMGRRADSRLTPELAREICERTGSTAVLDGSIASLGSQYVVGLRARNCRSGDVLDEEQVQAPSKEDVLNALDQIARTFRVRVGESLTTIKEHDTPLQEATTPSLEALKAYSAAWKVAFSTGFAAAVPDLRRAIEIDPNFAMAHGYLGRIYGDIGESVLSAESTAKAYQLRDRTSDREKLFITASYDLQVTGNLEKAKQTLELWAQTYPREAGPHGLMSGTVYQCTGNYEEAIEEAKKAIALDPDFTPGYDNLAYSYFFLDRAGDPKHLADAENVIQRASERNLEIADFLLLRYNIASLKGDKAGMERAAARAKGKLGAEDWMSHVEALTLARSGQLQKAMAMEKGAVQSAEQAGQRERAAVFQTGEAVWEALFGNGPVAKRSAMAALALSKGRDVEYGVAFALALAGDYSQSDALADDLEKRFPEDTSVRFTYLPTLCALLALKKRDAAKAFELLQINVPYELAVPNLAFFGFYGSLYAPYVRGEAYLATRKGANAAIEFEKILEHPGLTFSDPIGAAVRLQLGRAFVLSGDKTKAKAAYQDFLTFWKDADADIPILKQAQAEYANLQ
ncbi:MAG: winged helix-turn-helix domain-containing protein [Bryobacteraceae bacterium]